jgi:putative phosphoesterase
MKIGIVSDIHAQASALRRAIEDMPSVDRLFCAGDAVSEYRFCPETVELLQQYEVQCIQGNHEKVLFGGANQHYLEKCRAEYDAQLLEALAAAPTTVELKADGTSVLLVHASPWRPFDEYILPTSRQLPRFAELPYDVVIMGHTHIPMVLEVGEVLVVNPGSCSQPRDGTGEGSYAVLDLATREVCMRRLPLT